MHRNRREMAYETLREELAGRRLGYPHDGGICLWCRQELGALQFEDLDEDALPELSAGLDFPDDDDALEQSGPYYTECMAAEALRIPLARFRSLRLVPDRTIDDLSGDGKSQPVYLQERIHEIGKVQPNLSESGQTPAMKG